MNSEKKNQLLIIGVVLGLIILISGGTYAYLTWVTSNTQETAVTFTVKENFSCSADGGGNIIETDVDIVPTTCDDTRGRVIKRKVTTTASLNGTSVVMDLWLNINKLGTGLSNSTNFMYKLTKGEDCNSQTVTSGSFNGKTVGDTVNLLNGVLFEATGSKEYYLWIWLDAAEEDKSTQNQPFDLSLGGECTQVDSTAPIKAIYSADDNSLRFYNGNNLPSTLSTGDTYNDLTVTAMWEVDDSYTSEPPWSSKYRNITTAVVEDMIFPTSTAWWFSGLYNITNINATKLYTTKVTNMNSMFANMRSFSTTVTYNLGNWDTSNVTDMTNMFLGVGMNATTVNIIGIENWNTSNVKSMMQTFMGVGLNATNLDIGDISNWNTSNVTTMYYMFYDTGYNATDFTLNLSSWDVSKVKDYGSFNYGVESKITPPVWVN